MKRFINKLLVLAFVALAFACADDALDPLQFKSVKKGTILALRGQQLENIYFLGLPGAIFNPRTLDGTETFDFDAEILAEDPNSLASVDIFAVKRIPNPDNTVTLERVFLENVPFSEFKQTDDYLRPWVSVSILTTDILEAIGLDYTDPDDVETILDVYEFGIAIECDLNLTDGSKVLAADIVASGLFQSNQFYPAHKLTYSVLNYCPEDLEGTYQYATTVTAVGAGGDIGGCVGVITGDGELVRIGIGIYSVSDASFGQYDCAWADNPATGVTLSNFCDELSFGGSDQYDLVYTISNVSVSPDGTQLSFKWENDYGDKGNTTLTRTDSKLWPTTLYSED